MSEAVRYYTRNRKENTSEDSGVESGNSLENNGESRILVMIIKCFIKIKINQLLKWTDNGFQNRRHYALLCTVKAVINACIFV